MFYCNKCNGVKVRLRGKKRRLVCKPCERLKMKKYREINFEKLKLKKQQDHDKDPSKRRNRTLKRTYGITLVQYLKLAEAQNNTCEICKKPESLKSTRYKNLSVDHCHKTGKIRGLLCNKCNRALGLLNDSINNAINLANYLTKSIT